MRQAPGAVQSRESDIRGIVYSLLVVTLIACGGNPRAPVEERHARASSSSKQYLVQRGDTLYSIAFRYGLDYRKVAAANGIASPYTIYPGQRISLREAEVVKTAKAAPAAPPGAASKTAPKASGASSSQTVKTTPSVSKSSSASAAKTVPTRPKPAPAGPVKSWRWPSSGKVVRGYSSSVHKGIDISGRKGDTVVAAAAGQVVYAGTGIVGLGELVIVKHNELYLSAYGHNSRLLVREGDPVRSGQKIAEKGSSGTDTVKLHFEIRKEGKPIDPQRLLPRR